MAAERSISHRITSRLRTILGARSRWSVSTGHIGVGEKDLETGVPFAYIVQCLDRRIGPREALALQVSLGPFEEQLDQWFVVR
jgi:hypothetical protein